MKHILYIGNHLSRGGAYPSVAEEIAAGLKPDFDLHLISRRRNKLLRMLHMLWSIVRYGRKQQPVIIDVYSTLNFYYALICGLLCRSLNISYYCVLHGGGLPVRLHKTPLFCYWLFGRAKKIISPSGYLQSEFARLGYDVRVIPNPINIRNYPFKQREKIMPKLLWVRAFDAIYNPQMAIKVLKVLRSKYPTACLCMVGPDKDGSLKDCIELAKKLGVSDGVTFTGLLTKEAWIKLSEHYDIFINTTNIDNTPVSVVEAMALGLPIVSTNVGGIPWLLENQIDGCLVPPNDIDQFTDSLFRLLSNREEVKKMTQLARLKAESRDWKVIRKKWIELLK